MSVYEHYRKEEHPFVDQVLGWKEIVTDQYRPKLTDFLDPRQQAICKQLIGKNNEVLVNFSGGYENAERKRCFLYPSYYSVEEDDFELAFFEIKYPTKFVHLEHRDVLGALMNIGLKREKFGDILTDGERFQIVVAHEVADFVQWNLQQVGKAKIELIKIDSENLLQIENDFEEREFTVSSLRLDTVISEVYKIPRSKAKPLIEAGLVKVNWQTIDDASFLLMESDVISLRGKGRSKFLQMGAVTKKGKRRITVGFPK